MPYTRDGRFEWEYPAQVISVRSGNSFLAEIDLGFNVHVRAEVIAEGITVDQDNENSTQWLAARKEAQRLLTGVLVTLRTRKLVYAAGGLAAVLADVAYSPYHEPRSEQGSFEAAMLASGLVRKRTPSAVG